MVQVRNNGRCGKMASPARTLVAALLARLEPSLRFRFSLIALGGQQETQAGRDAPHIGQGTAIWPRDYVRPRPALARDAAHGQDTSSSTARLRPVQGVSSNREIGHFCTASITLAPLRRTETTELTVKT